MSAATLRRRVDVSRGPGAGGRPVLLVTLGVPLMAEAAAFAVDAAVESGQGLVVANVTPLEPLRMSIVFGYDALEEFTPEVSASLRAPVELAGSLGVRVERLRIRTPRPIQALVELADEQRPGVLVFGPDPAALSARRYRRVRAAVLERVTCLVWTPPAVAPTAMS